MLDLNAAPNLKILICEDDDVLLNVLCFTFEKRGFKVHRAENSHAALPLLRRNKFDILLTDSVLSDPTCINFISSLEEKPTIFILSGDPERVDKNLKAMSEPLIFKKPVSISVMLGEIYRAIKVKQTAQKNCKILISDEQSGDRGLMARTLLNARYVVDQASTWTQALDMMTKKPNYYYIF